VETTTSYKGCEYDGKKYTVGETWTPTSANNSQCLECSCTNEEGNIHCENLHDRCNLTCAGQLTYVPGQCCPICQSDVCDVKTTESKLLTSDGGLCVSTEKVDMTACVGTCGSSAHTIAVAPFIQTNCKCCKPARMEKKEVTMDCADGSKKTREHVVITACNCEACQYNPFGPSVTTAQPITVA